MCWAPPAWPSRRQPVSSRATRVCTGMHTHTQAHTEHGSRLQCRALLIQGLVPSQSLYPGKLRHGQNKWLSPGAFWGHGQSDIEGEGRVEETQCPCISRPGQAGGGIMRREITKLINHSFILCAPEALWRLAVLVSRGALSARSPPAR